MRYEYWLALFSAIGVAVNVTLRNKVQADIPNSALSLTFIAYVFGTIVNFIMIISYGMLPALEASLRYNKLYILAICVCSMISIVGFYVANGSAGVSSHVLAGISDLSLVFILLLSYFYTKDGVHLEYRPLEIFGVILIMSGVLVLVMKEDIYTLATGRVPPPIGQSGNSVE